MNALPHAMLIGYSFKVVSDDTVEITSPQNKRYTIAAGHCNCPAAQYNPLRSCKHEHMVADLAKFLMQLRGGDSV